MAAYIDSTNIITSLGFTIKDNFKKITDDISGISEVKNEKIFPDPMFLSLVDSEKINILFSEISDPTKYTRFEKLCILSIHEALHHSNIKFSSDNTILILSSTKGNIDLLSDSSNFESNRKYLWKSADVIAKFFKQKNKPLTISNACISGVLALSTAERLIKNNKYKNAIVVGADIISEFVVSGFNAFKSLEPGQCRPFDKSRNGLNIGEGVGTIILSTEKTETNISLLGGGNGNDANHISGPSRTGEGLFIAVNNALKYTNTDSAKIDFISAHGTATPYNDEMESIAFSRLDLANVPINSLKGYFGHTLGAAGIIESAITVNSMMNNVIINTIGYKEHGVSEPINVVNKTQPANINIALKTASGFGGCNAAVIFEKNEQ